eukprot:CAMPEP_0114359974 /NCGR_PEP_ID=MMETSP0101-20121206/23446_1 /TAXON_ID=38822 ORGANISM="Pteridomonas danica, Strain PT" /NCGR_SAMPLE_ID=MMETSP0101 /ASSEMBLY_ACC=CAM_ASM_000211 /LENGTH=199 /DNA_ID=CAMNT_0001503839 /DNA_START=45 /DNA_END=644 /DNA_ORIENTATION=+
MQASQSQSIGHWSVADFNETSPATSRFSKSQFLDDKDLRRTLTRTQAAMENTKNTPNSHGSMSLRNKLSEAAHTRTTSLLNHEKDQISRTVTELHDDSKVMYNQLQLGNSELGRLKSRQEVLMNRLEHDKRELEMVDKHLQMFQSMQQGTMVESQKKCAKNHSVGIQILQQNFGYNPIFRRPGDTFEAKSSFIPRFKNL